MQLSEEEMAGVIARWVLKNKKGWGLSNDECLGIAHAIAERQAEGVVHSEEATWDTECLMWPVVRVKRPLMLDARDGDDVMPGVTFMAHGPVRYEEFPGEQVRVYVVRDDREEGNGRAGSQANP